MFDADRYTVKGTLLSLGKQYTVYEGETPILSATRERFRLVEGFDLAASDGSAVIRVTTDRLPDVDATYTVVDSRVGEVVGALRHDWRSAFRHHWDLLDADGERVATVEEDSPLLALARRKLTSLIPCNYDVVGAAGDRLGRISGRLTNRHAYGLDLGADRTGVVDPRLVIAAAVVIDAVEGT